MPVQWAGTLVVQPARFKKTCGYAMFARQTSAVFIQFLKNFKRFSAQNSFKKEKSNHTF
ncbi:MAG TPA: hypothetical protein VEC36_07390 [Patescibacteria group bacterium]|nr:hypothetical protein [Patescibacteria group bacterium]